MDGIIGRNLPTTDPRWIDQRLIDGKELTPEEQKISAQQAEVLRKTIDTLNQPVQKGDFKAARARVNALKQQFQSLSPEMKGFLYETLQMKIGKNDLSSVFHNKLSSATRNELLKELNPEHQVDHIQERPLSNDCQEKLRAFGSVMRETDLEGKLMEKKLHAFMDGFNCKQEKKGPNEETK